MLIIYSALVYCAYSSYCKIKEQNNSIDKNEKLSNDIKHFISTVKNIIISKDISDYPDKKSTLIKKFLIDYLDNLEDFPYLSDFESSEIVSTNSDTYEILNNVDKVVKAYTEIDWKYLISLKSNNYYYLTKLNLLDDIKSFINILNTTDSSEESTFDYHYISEF
jgi:hypothetical protein